MSLLAQLPAWLPMVTAAVGGGGIGAGMRPLLEYWKGQRKQTDEVAMGLVAKLQARIEGLEKAQAHERDLCDAKLEVLRLEVQTYGGDLDALLLAIAVAPEKAAEIVAEVKERRSSRAAGDVASLREVRGNMRQNQQVALSELRELPNRAKSET